MCGCESGCVWVCELVAVTATSASLYTLDLVLLLVGACRVEMLKDGGVWLQVTGVTKRAVGSSLLLRGSLSRLLRSSLAGMAGKTRGILETQKEMRQAREFRLKQVLGRGVAGCVAARERRLQPVLWMISSLLPRCAHDVMLW